MNRRLALIVAAAAVLALFGSVYVVREGQAAIVLNLGKVVRTDLAPGLHFKWPLIESRLVFDRRLQVLSADAIIGTATISSNSILYSSKSQIKGLTTSVGLWCCIVLGMAVGAGLYTLSLGLFLFMLTCMSSLPALEKMLKDRSNHFEVHLELKNKSDLPDFVSTVRALGIRIDDIEANPAYLNSGISVFSVSFTVASAELKHYKKHADIIDALRSLDYVYHIEEMM